MIRMQCPECGLEEVSGEATACPQCGYAIATLSGFSIAQRLREAAPEEQISSEEIPLNISPKNFQHSEKGSKKKTSRFFPRSRKKSTDDISLEESSRLEQQENNGSKNHQETAVSSLTQAGLFNPVPENLSPQPEPVQKQAVATESELALAETQTHEELSVPGIHEVQLTAPVTPLLPEKEDQSPITIETENIGLEEEHHKPEDEDVEDAETQTSEPPLPVFAEEADTSAAAAEPEQADSSNPIIPEQTFDTDREEAPIESNPESEAPAYSDPISVSSPEAPTFQNTDAEIAFQDEITAVPESSVASAAEPEQADSSNPIIPEQTFDTNREEAPIESNPESEAPAYSDPISVSSAEAPIFQNTGAETASEDEITAVPETSAASAEATESAPAFDPSDTVQSFSSISNPTQEEISANKDQAEEIIDPTKASAPEFESSSEIQNFQDDGPDLLNEGTNSAPPPSIASSLEATPELIADETSIPPSAASTEENFSNDFEDNSLEESHSEESLPEVEEQPEPVFTEDSHGSFGVHWEEKLADLPIVLDDQGSSCYECGKEVDANANFCPHCHASLLRRICAGCNRLVAGNTAFCAYCGTAASAVAEPPRNFASILAVFIILFTGILIFLAKDFVFEDPAAIKNRVLAHEKSGVTALKPTTQRPIQKSQDVQPPIQKSEQKDDVKITPTEPLVVTSPKAPPAKKTESLSETDLPAKAPPSVAPMKIVSPKERPAVATPVESKPKNISVEASNQASTKTRTSALNEVPVTGIPQYKHRDPALARYLNAVGYRLMREQRYDEAIPILQRSVSYFPDRTTDISYAYALFNLGHALRMSGRAHEAIPILEARMRIDNQRETVRRELEAAKLAALQH